MKYIAWFMVALVILAIVGVGYAYVTAQVSIGEIKVQTIPATQQEELFNQLDQDIQRQSFKGTMLSKNGIEENSAAYSFYTYQIEINNQTFLTADTVEVQTVPNAEDVIQLAQQEPLRIEKRSGGTVQVTLLTKQNTPVSREFVITYYLWGLPFSLRTIVEP